MRMPRKESPEEQRAKEARFAAAVWDGLTDTEIAQQESYARSSVVRIIAQMRRNGVYLPSQQDRLILQRQRLEREHPELLEERAKMVSEQMKRQWKEDPKGMKRRLNTRKQRREASKNLAKGREKRKKHLEEDPAEREKLRDQLARGNRTRWGHRPPKPQ